MKRIKILFSPDDAPGNGSANTGEKPPAADLVVKSPASEAEAAEMVRLRRQLDEEKTARKREQTRLSELEDENFQLKKVTPRNDAAKAKESKWAWLNP